MNRRQLLGAGIAAAVSFGLPWRSRRPKPASNPHDLFVPEIYCGPLTILTKNTVIATFTHRDFDDDEKNGSHPRFLSVGHMAQAAA